MYFYLNIYPELPHVVQVLDYIVGEGCSDILFEFIDIALIHYKNQKQISSHNLPIELEKHRQVGKVLYFPSKVHFIPHRDQLVVSDTGNHRLLLLDAATGVVMASFSKRHIEFCEIDEKCNHIFIDHTFSVLL